MRCLPIVLLAACAQTPADHNGLSGADTDPVSADSDPDPYEVETETDTDIAVSERVRFTRHVVDASADGPAFTTVVDLDGDGVLDVLASRFGEISGLSLPKGTVAVYRQGADLGDWSKEIIVSESEGVYFPNHTTVFDADDDGDLDFVLPSGFLVCDAVPLTPDCGALSWFEQTASGWQRHDLVTGSPLFFHSAQVVDLDEDGITDLLTVQEKAGGFLSSGEAWLTWFRGVDGPERWDPTPIVIAEGGGSLLQVLDLDDDGDPDVVSGEYFAELDASYVWFENTAAPSVDRPQGRFTRHVIDANKGPSIQLEVIDDLFGDGQRIAVGSNHTNTTQSNPDPWPSELTAYPVPSDPKREWTGLAISTGIESVPGSAVAPQAAPGIFAHGDVDGDGDQDLVASGDGDPNVYVLEQISMGVFETHILEADIAQAGGLNVVDLNGDGRNDIVITGYEDNIILVFERQ